jgi:Fe2+ or Zn2+ uptake regulation protein
LLVYRRNLYERRRREMKLTKGRKNIILYLARENKYKKPSNITKDAKPAGMGYGGVLKALKDMKELGIIELKNLGTDKKPMFKSRLPKDFAVFKQIFSSLSLNSTDIFTFTDSNYAREIIKDYVFKSFCEKCTLSPDDLSANIKKALIRGLRLSPMAVHYVLFDSPNAMAVMAVKEQAEPYLGKKSVINITVTLLCACLLSDLTRNPDPEYKHKIEDFLKREGAIIEKLFWDNFDFFYTCYVNIYEIIIKGAKMIGYKNQAKKMEKEFYRLIPKETYFKLQELHKKKKEGLREKIRNYLLS